MKLACTLLPKTDGSWRVTVLGILLLWGAAAVLLTELLSLFGALWPGNIVGFWIGLALGTVGYLGALVRTGRLGLPPRWPAPSLPLALGLLLVGLAVLTGCAALVGAPNVRDVLTYHLPRVMQWHQAGSVAFFATANPRQLYHAPGAEFALLQLYLVTGSDQFFNLVAWVGLLGALFAVSLIAERLGADGWGQLLAAIVAFTAPVSLFQGTSSKNLALLSCWLAVFVALMLRLNGQGGRPVAWWSYAGLGVSLGLAMVTHALTYVYAAPFLGWLVWKAVRCQGWRAWRPLLLVAAIALALNAGQYLRNTAAVGWPLGPNDAGSPAFRYANDAMSPSIFLSNVMRNAALHLQTPSVSANRVTEGAVRVVHALLGADADDPRSTWAGTTFTVERFGRSSESSPWHLLLIVAVLALALSVWRRRTTPTTLLYAAAVLVGFGLFCLVLRWQPWHQRLHLPLFVLWAPFAAAGLVHAAGRRWSVGVAAALLVLSLPWVLLQPARPLLGREGVFATERWRQYFYEQAPDLAPYFAVIERELMDLGCHTIGIYGELDDVEYPLWIAVRRGLGPQAQLRHVGVSNHSARFGSATYSPCAVVTLTRREAAELVIDGVVYARPPGSRVVYVP